MKLTTPILRNFYNALVVCHPFTKWDMPLAAQIDFVVDSDDAIMGSYMYEDGEKYEHTITISSAKCGHISTVIRVLCHEMAHCSFYRQKGDKWLQHGKPFRTRCKMISDELGFDPLEL